MSARWAKPNLSSLSCSLGQGHVARENIMSIINDVTKIRIVSAKKDIPSRSACPSADRLVRSDLVTCRSSRLRLASGTTRSVVFADAAVASSSSSVAQTGPMHMANTVAAAAAALRRAAEAVVVDRVAEAVVVGASTD